MVLLGEGPLPQSPIPAGGRDSEQVQRDIGDNHCFSPIHYMIGLLISQLHGPFYVLFSCGAFCCVEGSDTVIEQLSCMCLLYCVVCFK